MSKKVCMKTFRYVMQRTYFLSVLLLLPLLAFGQAITPAARGKIMDAIRAKNDALSTLPSDARKKQVVAYMKTFKEIEDAMVTEDGNLACGFRDKVPYMIIDNVFIEPEKPKSELEVLLDSSRLADVAFKPDVQVSIDPFVQPSFASANDLPLNTNAMICNALGPNAFGQPYVKIRELLNSKSYRVRPGVDCSIPTLKTVADIGAFYYFGHGGNGRVFDKLQMKWGEQYVLVSGDEWSQAEETAFYLDGSIGDGLIGMCEAVYDLQGLLNRAVSKRYFTITKAFIKKHWKFSENSYVNVNACTSIRLADVMKTAPVNASVFSGFNDLSTKKCWKGIEFLTDRMLGANDDQVEPAESGWPQRPFDYARLEPDMMRKGLYPVVYNYEGATHRPVLQFSTGPGNFGLLAPSIRNLIPVAFQKKVELHGIFGEDPGEANRSVQIGGIAIVVEKWKPDKIIAFLPDNEHTSHGEVKVFHMGRPSNSRWLSNWKGTFTLNVRGEQSLKQKAEFLMNFIGDPWPYRENPGEPPTIPFIWTLNSVFGSTCTWSYEGEEKDSNGKVIRSWSGQGNPKVWVDEGGSRKKTFGIGGMGDSWAKKVNFTMAINDTFSLMERGSTEPNTPIRLGDWSQGQSLLEASYNSDFGIIGKTLRIEDEPSRLSYGGINGNVTWTSMECRLQMPNNAPR